MSSSQDFDTLLSALERIVRSRGGDPRQAIAPYREAAHKLANAPRKMIALASPLPSPAAHRVGAGTREMVRVSD